jgi:hypothetical protein
VRDGSWSAGQWDLGLQRETRLALACATNVHFVSGRFCFAFMVRARAALPKGSHLLLSGLLSLSLHRTRLQVYFVKALFSSP